jgi:hypothetical protein
VTIVSIVDVAVSSNGRLAVLRAIRVLRLFRLFRMLKSLRRIGNVLMKAMGSFASIMMLVLLFLFVFTVLGMHAFGDIRKGEVAAGGPALTRISIEEFTRVNFDTFLTSFQAVFQAITLEEWDWEMYTVGECAPLLLTPIANSFEEPPVLNAAPALS